MVAKSYQKLSQYGEPYKKNNKMYVTVVTDRGMHKEVRWYSEQEYAKMYPEEKVAYSKIRSTKEVLGFKNGYISIIKGDTYSFKEWFALSDATYHKFWGWSFASDIEELPELPAGLEYKQLKWEDVAFVDEDELKSESVIKEAIAALVYEESDSEHQGTVGERIQKEFLVVKAIELDGYYGPSTMYIFNDEDGNEWVWTTSARKLEVGENYTLRGTIREHKIYKNTKQTILTRCMEVK